MTNKKEKIPYKIRTIRISDKTWEYLKGKRWESNLSWEKFIISLIKKI